MERSLDAMRDVDAVMFNVAVNIFRIPHRSRFVLSWQEASFSTEL